MNEDNKKAQDFRNEVDKLGKIIEDLKERDADEEMLCSLESLEKGCRRIIEEIDSEDDLFVGDYPHIPETIVSCTGCGKEISNKEAFYPTAPDKPYCSRCNEEIESLFHE